MTSSSDESITAQVLEAENERIRAIEANDWTTVEQIYATEFTYTHSNGRIEHKEEHIEHMRPKARKITRGNLVVRTYGDVALTNGPNHFFFGPQPDGSPEEVDIEVMQVWVKRDGRWQIVAHQGTKYGTPH